jgi:hypothetical protein
MLHQPDHVIAEIAEQPGRHRGQAVGHLDPAFGQERTQGIQRVARQIGKGRGSKRASRLIRLDLPWHCQIRSGFIPTME